jgi:uncharacterized protein YaaN involved in tellurite resistance
VVAGKMPETALKIVGQKYVDAITFTIDAGTFSNPKVSPTWAAVKGFDDAMYHFSELRDLQNKAQMTGKAEDAQAAKDLEDLCNRFEKKLYDLELTRMVSIQTAPQIRMIQNSDSVMAEKIQSTLVNTIPLWKNQMIIALGVHHSTEAAKAQRQVSDMTNELLKKNAENLKMATIETAKESERGIVDMETLKQTNQSLISTLDEVMKIQEDGRQKRAAAEVELVQLENDIKKKMLELSAGGQH